MNRLHVRRVFAAAFAFLCLGLTPAPAEVKLRIYLHDGSLQSGNLVTENANTFVILTKDGARVEIPRKDIMFINGKTLKQWEERPDKFFQTEIMPSEVPDPAFVNNKAALPKVPALAAQKPAEKPVEKKPAPVPTATPAPVVEGKPIAATPKPTPTPRPSPKSTPSPTPTPTPAPQKMDKPQTPPPAVTAAAPAEGERKLSKRLRERAAKGARHRERAFVLMEQGEQGQAIQNFLIARLLEPDHGDTYLALARVSRDEGLYDLALKYYTHWTLRKSKDATDEAEAVRLLIEAKKKMCFISRSPAPPWRCRGCRPFFWPAGSSAAVAPPPRRWRRRSPSSCRSRPRSRPTGWPKPKRLSRNRSPSPR